MQHALPQGTGRKPHSAPDPAPSRMSQAGARGRASDAGSPASAGLGRAIDRLEEVLEQETTALRSRAPIDLKDFNTRKSHGLLELTHAMRLFEPGGLNEPMRARLAGLRAKIETNRAAIATHLEAAREISTIMADAMSKSESDGTYSASIVRIGLKP